MQLVEFDKQLNLVKTEIKSPFWHAGTVLNWGWKSGGLGFNQQIINTCLEYRAGLLVHVKYNSTNYMISYEKLKNFLETFDCDYTVKNGYRLKVISWDWFTVMEP